MKKGEARRQAILETAARLFFTKGYENTSVQDILAEMKLSKGGFYHHFESKQQLLEEICAERARTACAEGLSRAESAKDAVEKLNALLIKGGLFGEESVKYVSTVLECAYGGEMLKLRETMRGAMADKYAAPLTDILIEGMEQGLFYLRSPEGTARLIILLACDAFDEIASAVAEGPASPDAMASVTDLLETYRRAVELLIDAPYGSVELIDVRRFERMLAALNVLRAQG